MPEQQPTTYKEKEIVYLQQTYPCSTDEDEINLLELWNIIWKGKWIISLIVLLASLLAYYTAFFYLPVTYKSEAVLLEIQQSKSPLGGLSGLIGSLPVPFSPPGGSQTSIISFLESRTLQERLITKYNLLPVLYKNIWDAEEKRWIVQEPGSEPTIVKVLQSHVLSARYQVNQDSTSGLVTISWIDGSPEFCEIMLRRIITELNSFLDNEYVSSARREREFVEKQLSDATRELEFWEQQVPTEKISLAKITREQLASQTVYTELRKQLELAKISEAKENIGFKVLDEPFVPETRYKPNRKLIVLLSFVTSFFFAIFFVFFLNFVRKLREGS